MTTYYAFTPNTTSTFQFQPTLDGEVYQAIIVWNLWGQRWYLNLYANSGPLVVAEPVISSVDQVTSITLTTTQDEYTATVSSATGLLANQAIASANVPAGTTIQVLAGTTVRLSQPATATGTDPAAVFSFDVNLLAGYGFASTLVFRDSSQNFEVNP